jgi:signal transduction histidine kinase
MLDLINQTLNLLSQSPADLVYYLIVLFAIEAILALAVMRARRSSWTRTLRLMALAGGVMLAGRIVLIVISLLALQDPITNAAWAAAVLPPLERYVDLVSLIFLAWAFVPLLRERNQLGLGLVAVMLVAATIFYAFSAAQWYNQSIAPNAFYNATTQDLIWQAWMLAVAALAAVAAWANRQGTSILSGSAFLVLALGSLFQLIFGAAASNVAAWVRLAQLIAYPMFAVIAYQLTEAAVPRQIAAPPSYPLLPTRSEATEQAWRTLTIIQSLSTSAELADGLQQTAGAFAEFMGADLAAIGLIGVNANTLELTAVHHPGAAPTRGAVLPIDRYPLIRRVLETRLPLHFDNASAPSEIRTLYGLFGSFVVGPIILVALCDDQNALGLVVLGNPDSGRAWSPADVEHAETLSEHTGLMLTARSNRQRFSHRIEELESALHQQEAEATQRRTTLESLLQQSQAEAQKTAVRLAALAALQEAQDGAERDQIKQLEEERTELQRQTLNYQAELNNLIQLQTSLELQLKQAQQEMSRLQNQWAGAPSSKMDEQQGEVLASMVQEFRTPMTSISGYIDLLLGESVGILGAMQRQFLQRVKANIVRLEGMLGDLVQITAIDTGTIKLETAPFDVPDLIKDTAMSASTIFREREQSIRLELSDNLPELHTDRERLQQILLHLLTNAALCSPNQAEIIVRVQRPAELPDYLLFSVSDRGGGIALEDRLRVFHRMYRADHPLLQGVGETGVGLAIAKALVEAQGGRIWVDSEMGVGSTFTFILPLQPEPQTAQVA